MAIRYQKDGRVVTITIDRPEARNALDLEHFGALAKAWIDFRDDEDAWVAIITGTGTSFCAGADLKKFIPAVTGAVPELRRAQASGGKDVKIGGEIPPEAPLVAVLREFELDKPVIAAVNGICVAGGMEMLCGTDIRIASSTATFGIVEPRRGLFPGGGTTVRLPRQIPFARAMEILLVCDQIPAEEAERIGLVNKVVEPGELLAEARRWAGRICENAPLAVRAVKRSVLQGLRLPLAEAFEQELALAAQVFMTEDAKEGPRAFAEKRKPAWQGK